MNNTNIFKNNLPRILLIGCGKRQVETILDKVVALDIAKACIIESKKKKRKNIYCVADVTKLPFKDDAFNKIICTAVLEHLPIPSLALKEIYRVLNKHGQVITRVPTMESENLFSKMSPVYKRDVTEGFHKTMFKKEELLNQLKKAGFDHLTCEYVNSFDFWYSISMMILIKFFKIKSNKLHIEEVGELKVKGGKFLKGLIFILQAFSRIFAHMLSIMSRPILKKSKIAKYISRSIKIIATKE